MKHLKTSETRDGISWARVNRGTDISPPKKHNALPSLFNSFICPSKATQHWNWHPPKPQKRIKPKHQTCRICSCIPARPWFLQSRRLCPAMGFQPTRAKFVKPNSKSSAEFPFQRNIETQHVSRWESALNKMRYCLNRLASSTHPSATRWAQCASSSGPKTSAAKTLRSRRLWVQKLTRTSIELPGSIACSPSARQSWTNWRACAQLAAWVPLFCENGLEQHQISIKLKDNPERRKGPKSQLWNTGAPPAPKVTASQRPLITVPEQGDGSAQVAPECGIVIHCTHAEILYCSRDCWQRLAHKRAWHHSADRVWDGSNKSQNKLRPETAVQETSNHNGQSGSVDATSMWLWR